MEAKYGEDIPLGLGMALMQNPDAYFHFLELDADSRRKIIDGTHGIKSREEMQSYVDKISAQG